MIIPENEWSEEMAHLARLANELHCVCLARDAAVTWIKTPEEHRFARANNRLIDSKITLNRSAVDEPWIRRAARELPTHSDFIAALIDAFTEGDAFRDRPDSRYAVFGARIAVHMALAVGEAQPLGRFLMRGAS